MAELLRKSSLVLENFFNGIGEAMVAGASRRGSVESRKSLSSEVHEDELFLGDKKMLEENDSRDLTLLAEYLREDLNKINAKHTDIMYPSIKKFEKVYERATFGAVEAQFVLASWYHFGRKNGIVADYQSALKWYLQAALQKDHRATNNIGVMYIQGEGVEKDEVRGLQWLEVAALSGDVYSRLNLSVWKTVAVNECHRDQEKAFDIISKLASEVENRHVYNNLACMYARALGTETDYEKAMYYFRLASDLDSNIAKYNIGVMYLNGLGVERSVVQGHQWMKAARSDKNHEDYRCVTNCKDATKLLMLTTMTFHYPIRE